ncbi:MAG: MBL fold metallo-hydrolase [Thiothrix sp.]|nr:MBL fold metallo-hydrolase [Thiothrix sp.]HPE62067.1 MBL fold metallo-hydrolase [Thiolinea sp.]
MLRFSVLGSGSRGNATLIESGKTRVLVDCGFPVSETERRLLRLGCPPETLSAILVTHEHGDHANGVGRLSRRYRLPVWLTVGTFNALRDREFRTCHYINISQPFEVGALSIQPYPVLHDAREPCQFIFSDGALRLGLLTDSGSISAHMIEQLQGLDALLLECNYDAHMLATGPYPPALRARVGGKYGHLDNRQATGLLQQLDRQHLQQLVGMHLSEKNNLPEHAGAALCEGVGCSADWISLADQALGLDWREVR